MRPAIKLSKSLQGVNVTKVNQIPVPRPNCCSTDRNPSLQESRGKKITKQVGLQPRDSICVYVDSSKGWV